MLGTYIAAIVEDDFGLRTILRSGRALSKRKWIAMNFAELTDELIRKLWTMYAISYDYASVRFKRPSELAGEFRLLWMVDVEALVKRLLDGKRIEWLGGGRYARSISGLSAEIKRMYGRPIIGGLSEEAERPDPWGGAIIRRRSII